MRRRAVVGAIASVAVSVAGWRLSALSGRGAVAAVGVGSTIAAGASWPGMAVLGTFFVSSSALSRVTGRDSVAAKGSRRDERQVLANGAIAAVSAVVAHRVDSRLALPLVAGSLSAAAADTWATEIGARSRATPRLIVSGVAVARGTSGGVTRAGSLASLGGATVIGLVAGILIGITNGWAMALRVGSAVTIAGVAGSLADSVLGERIQERRYCPACESYTESIVHLCGTETRHVSGIEGLDNDLVNLACTAVGCIVTFPFVGTTMHASEK